MGDAQSIRRDFETMRHNVLRSGRAMSVDDMITFLSSFLRVCPAAPGRRPAGRFDKMLI